MNDVNIILIHKKSIRIKFPSPIIAIVKITYDSIHLRFKLNAKLCSEVDKICISF